MYPVEIACIRIAASRILCGIFVLAGAGLITGPGAAAEAVPKTGPAVSASGGPGNTPAISTSTAPPVVPLPPARPAVVEPRGRVYLFRGALGPIFSRGMDRLTQRIEQAGIKASVNEFTVCRFIAEGAIRDYRQDPAPITIVGHSMGGLCALEFAEILKSENIPASLVVTIDPAQMSRRVPLNVERYINIFLSDSVLGAGDVVPENGYQGHYASFDLSEHKDVLHINVDKMDSIQTQLVTKIRRLATTPPKSDRETVPIRYVVPAGAAIDLWDSGVPVYVHAGETLETLAAFFHLPLWSLTQINQVPDTMPLEANRRIVVPRHLVPRHPVPLATGSIRSPPNR